MPRIATLIALLVSALLAHAHAQPPAAPNTAPEPAHHEPAQPEPFRTYVARDGRTLRFALLLPVAPPGARPAPMVVALPPGKGDEPMVRRALDAYWRNEAARRGWIVLSPAVPDGSTWAREPRLLGELLDHCAEFLRWENGLAHLAGVSTGGLAAFAAATEDPGRYASLTVLPGAPENDDVLLRLDRLRTVPVTIFVGATDAEFWLPQARRASQRLRDLNFEHELRELEGQGHVLTIDPAEVFDLLEARRPSRRGVLNSRESAVRAINTVLDDFHDAAAKADEIRYFNHFAPEAVFLGTDATERWTLPQFRAFAEPYFRRGSAWTYRPIRRSVGVTPSGDGAWFDETLENAKLGECRGSGALVRIDGRWRLTQYNLTVPVPNALMERIVEMIRDADPAATPTP